MDFRVRDVDGAVGPHGYIGRGVQPGSGGGSIASGKAFGASACDGGDDPPYPTDSIWLRY